MATHKDRTEDGDDGETMVRTRLERHYRAHAGWLGRTLRFRFGAGAEEAEDLVQESYLRMARYADGDHDRRPRALLLAIARNLLRDHRRSAAWRHGAQVQRALEPGEILPVEPDQAEQLLLKQIILGMPALYRDVFLLSRFSAMSYTDIARHLGLSVKTVEWRMTKALEHCSVQLRY
jgi:RNA polymerase sigma-70 factor (ECF subfamily)